LLDDSVMDETYSASNANQNKNKNHSKKEEYHNSTMPFTRHKSTRSSTSKAPTDALSMADISQVAVLLADLHESPLTLSAKDKKSKKSSKKQNKAGASITAAKSPASHSRRPVVVAKEGGHRGTSTSTKPAPVKVQVKEEDAYGPVLKLVPRVPYRRQQDGTYVRPRGRAPSGKAWDVIRGIWVASNTTTSNSSTAEPTGNIDSDSDDDSSRTLGSDNDDDDNSLDTVDGDCGDSFIENSIDNNEGRGAWVDYSLKAKTRAAASSQPKIGEKRNGVTVVNANVSANGNGHDKENMQGPVQPRHGRPSFRSATSSVAAVESKASVEECFLEYRNSHPRRHQYSTERSNRFASVATTAPAAFKKRREPSDVRDLDRRNQDKRRRQNPSAHAAKKPFAGESRTGYNTRDQLQDDVPKSLGVAPSDVPMVLPTEECGRHVASHFERSTNFGLPDNIPLIPGPFDCQPMPPSQIRSFDYPPGSCFFDMQQFIQNMVRVNNIELEHARSSPNMSSVHFAMPLPGINDLMSHLESAPWSCVLRHRLAGTSCPYTRARLYAALSRVERAEPHLLQFLRCLHQDG
jgi:hypothetical protein